MRQITGGIDQPGDLFLTEDDRQSPGDFRVGKILPKIRALEGSSEEELDRRHPLLDGIGRQLPVADQVQLELPDVFRPELIGWAFEIGGKLP